MVSVLSSRTWQHLKSRLISSSWKIDFHKHEAKRLLRRWKKYVVHAEMLLLLFYEEHPEIQLAQDYISISKRSCFLCANFIQLHKRFMIEGDLLLVDPSTIHSSRCRGSEDQHHRHINKTLCTPRE